MRTRINIGFQQFLRRTQVLDYVLWESKVTIRFDIQNTLVKGTSSSSLSWHETHTKIQRRVTCKRKPEKFYDLWLDMYIRIYIYNIHTQHNHFSIKPLPGLSHLISSWSVQTAMASHPWSHSRNGRSVGVFHVCFLCLHPWKLTCPPKRDYFSREYIFQPLIFRGHVSFQGSSFQPGGIVRNEFTEHKFPSVISV